MRERRKDYEKDLTSRRLELESLAENLTSAEERRKALMEELAYLTAERDKLGDKLRDTLEKQRGYTEKANKQIAALKDDLRDARKEIKNLKKVGGEDNQTIVISSSTQKATVE
jgi:seryl-tRNA synthetase